MNNVFKCLDKLGVELSYYFVVGSRLLSTIKNPHNSFTKRTHTCGELSQENVGENVILCGWLHYQRMNKFAVLRDAYGTVQVIVPDERQDIMKTLEQSSLESVVCIHGKVINRPKSQVNKNMATGAVEIIASNFSILNNVNKDLPFSIRNYNKAKESTRMKYRYLDLRFPEMQRNLRLRSKVIFEMRKNLIEKGFVEVETPTLFKRTPGGAQEFVVPTEAAGDFYALVQSPQQLKQLLMVGGVDRYFQVARCYRNEGARPDRQPEFTQLDIEMSFTNEELMMNLVEGLVRETWPETDLGPLLPSAFPRMTFNEAIQFYGCDKPDISSDIKIQKVDEQLLSNYLRDKNVRIISFPQGADLLNNSSLKKYIQDLKNQYKTVKLFSWKIPENSNDFESMISKAKIEMDHLNFLSFHHLVPGDLLFFALGNIEIDVLEMLGKIRIELLKSIASPNKWNMVWVTDFPLFEETENGLKSMHHPFSQPHPADIHLIDSEPLKVRGLHYDLVLNGWEIAGGSVRIHSTSLQKKILSMLNINSSGLQHMLEALDSGAPPHAGIAFGLDRYISLMVNAQSIRDVIAFPKTGEGRDLMSSAPAPITEDELELYNITVKKPTSNKSADPNQSDSIAASI